VADLSQPLADFGQFGASLAIPENSPSTWGQLTRGGGITDRRQAEGSHQEAKSGRWDVGMAFCPHALPP
jgi:hypothetical protein